MNAVAVFLLTIVLGVTGCATVPLTTILRMATFNDLDFAELEPNVIRVKIKLEDGFKLNAEQSQLAVQITSPAGSHYGHFSLETISVSQTELSQGVFSRNVLGTEYTLRLSDTSQKAFEKLKDFVKRGKPRKILVAIRPILSSSPQSAETVTVWVDLLITNNDGYFTLLEAAKVPMELVRKVDPKR